MASAFRSNQLQMGWDREGMASNCLVGSIWKRPGHSPGCISGHLALQCAKRNGKEGELRLFISSGGDKVLPSAPLINGANPQEVIHLEWLGCFFVNVRRVSANARFWWWTSGFGNSNQAFSHEYSWVMSLRKTSRLAASNEKNMCKIAADGPVCVFCSFVALLWPRTATWPWVC